METSDRESILIKIAKTEKQITKLQSGVINRTVQLAGTLNSQTNP